MNTHFIARLACPCCGAKNGQTLYDRGFCESPIREYLEAFYSPQGGVEFPYLEDARFTLIECRDCGLVYQQYIANDELMGLLYDRWIDPAKVFALVDGQQPARYFMYLAKQIANVVEYFGVPPSKLKCLDFGMGWGHWCRLARGFGCEVHGVELSAARIAFARENGLNVLPSEDIAKHQFDLINTEQVFEHLPDPVATLKQLVTALKPGGLIRISVPDGWGIKRRLSDPDWLAPKGSSRSLNAVAPLEHINCFTHEVIVRLASQAGLGLRDVPQNYAISLADAVRGLLKPIYYGLRGSSHTELYFSRG